MTGRQDDRQDDRQRTLDKYMIDKVPEFLCCRMIWNHPRKSVLASYTYRE
jgi:hypothetical protein